VRAIISVVSSEEQILGLQQPTGIGQRPRPMSTDFFSSVPSGVQRRSSLDMEATDDPAYASSGSDSQRLLIQGLRNAPNTSPNRNSSFQSRGSDERSDSSSVRSAGSCGSGPSSPCHSPTPSGSSSEKDVVHAPTRFFVIKASSQKAIEVSLSRGLWAFMISTERKIVKAMKESKTVFLIFSVQGSGHFQGVAYLVEPTNEKLAEFAASNVGNCFRVEWIKRANIPFQNTRHLLNPWNKNKKVQMSRDGQELEPRVGEGLCKLWDKFSTFVPKSILTAPSHYHGQNQGTHSDVSKDHMKELVTSSGYVTSCVSTNTGFRGSQQFSGRPIRGLQHPSIHGHHLAGHMGGGYSHQWRSDSAWHGGPGNRGGPM